MKIVFLGSADFGVPALKRIIDSKHRIAGIVTTPARPKGRGLKLAKSAVADFAELNGLTPVFSPENLRDEKFIENLKALEADLFIVIAYKILPEIVFDMPPRGTINAHASLLPQFRGPAPIHRALEAGKKETGVTVFRLDRGIDTGNILTQDSTFIAEDETTPELYRRLSAMAADQIMKSVEILEAGSEDYRSQDDSLATGAPKLKKSEGLINWSDSAVNIYNKIRAFKPFPGTFTTINGKKLGVEEARIDLSESCCKSPGTITAIKKDSFTVVCGKGFLQVFSVKPEGKNRMSVKDYLNGKSLNEGELLC